VAFFTIALFMVGLAVLPSETYVTSPPSSVLIVPFQE
jgi:hypothetical protein